MKTILHTLRSLSAALQGSSIHVRAIALLAVCTLGVGAYLYGAHTADRTFDIEYAAYADLARQADNAAYLPGAQNNPLRTELDQVLTQVLAGAIRAPDRLALAKRGLDLLTQAEAQLDDVTTLDDKVDALVAKMQVDTLGNVAPSDKARQIIALAKERSSTISDIRAYSYRADFETQKIFETIIADKGVLTDAYVVELNNEIPTVEQQFNQRSSLYTQLQNTSQKIEDIYAGRGN